MVDTWVDDGKETHQPKSNTIRSWMLQFPWCTFIVKGNGCRAWHCKMCKLAKRNVAGGLIPCTTLRKSVLRDHENGYVHQAIINPPKETITAALTGTDRHDAMLPHGVHSSKKRHLLSQLFRVAVPGYGPECTYCRNCRRPVHEV